MSTKIAWCEETWNPICGCTKCSPGCLNCYAERMAKRLKGMGISQYQDVVDKNGWTGEVSLVEKALDIPLHWKKPRVIFPVSMGDLFHPSVPFEFVDKMFNRMICKATQHKYLVLTKRPERMAEYIEHVRVIHKVAWSGLYEFPLPNVYLGTTICNQAEKPKRDILVQIPAAHRWLSIEPLLEDLGELNLEGIDHVVVGCESGPNRRPCKRDWMISLAEQCKAAGVKLYVKQVNIKGKVSHDPDKFPEQLQVREEI